MEESQQKVEELEIVSRLEDIDLSGETMVIKERTRSIVKICLGDVVNVINICQILEVIFDAIEEILTIKDSKNNPNIKK